MRFLLDPGPLTTLAELTEAGEAAHSAGLDGVFLSASPALPAPLVSAAALAARVPDLRIAVALELGDTHPYHVAEEAAVVDVASGGRLILVVAAARDAEDVYGEALDLLLTAFTPRPFRFEGATWKVPANLPENVHNVERKVRLTPAPTQPRLELWGAGAGREHALRRGLGYLADSDADLSELGDAWRAAESSLGAPALTAARARHAAVGDPERLVATLRAGREAFGQSWAVVRAPASGTRALGARVRPRVQLESLPEGLERFWDETVTNSTRRTTG